MATKEVATLNTQVPAHIAANIAARQAGKAPQSSVLDALVSGGRFPYPRVSIRAGRFRLVDDGVETPAGITMDVVLIGANPNVSKVFYGKPYDPDATDMRPDCFSNDGIKPDASVQAPVSKSCVNCPHNVLGSKMTPSGKKSKMCSDQRHLCVVSAADPSKLYGLTIPVSSMKSLREYNTDLKNRMLIPEEVVTQLSFDDATSYPRVIFSQKNTADGQPVFLSPEACAQVAALQKEKEQQIKEITRQAPISASAVLSGPVVDEEEHDETAGEELPVSASSPEIVAQLDKLMGRA
jgi:hypothetical protein